MFTLHLGNMGETRKILLFLDELVDGTFAYVAQRFKKFMLICILKPQRATNP